ncbi:PREDICTED: uncharacterized protein LOC108528956 [Rhinopithecus bieti]|uniref:uncharacterized protein LOC108528956 n=1 Tax=Rhinopithecus bieti TaxID=61621 RepID=UPI00083C3D6E|nr:PREDICTED: uncharacterized protein LOC108528956 [Rhinopithecus bieti]
MHQPDPRREQPEKRSPVLVSRTSRPAEPRSACELESKRSPEHARLQRRLPGNRSLTLPHARVPGAAEKEGPAGGGAGQDLPGGRGPHLLQPGLRCNKNRTPLQERRKCRAGPGTCAQARPAPPAQTRRPPQFPLVSASTSHAHDTPLTPPDRDTEGRGQPQVPFGIFHCRCLSRKQHGTR